MDRHVQASCPFKSTFAAVALSSTAPVCMTRTSQAALTVTEGTSLLDVHNDAVILTAAVQAAAPMFVENDSLNESFAFGNPPADTDEEGDENMAPGVDDDNLDGMAVLVIAMSDRSSVRRTRLVPQASAAARVRAFYDVLLEASAGRPVVDPSWARRLSRFRSPVLRKVLKIAFKAGGSGLTQTDQRAYADLLRAGEQDATRGITMVGLVAAASPTLTCFVTAARYERSRVLARRRCMHDDIGNGSRTFSFLYSDVLQVSLDAFARAERVSFGAEVSEA